MKNRSYLGEHTRPDCGHRSKRQFQKWTIQEQSRNYRLTLKYDLAKESLPYIGLLLVIVFGQGTVGVVTLVWLLHSLRKRFENRNDR